MTVAHIEHARRTKLLVVDNLTGFKARITSVYPKKNMVRLWYDVKLGGDGRFENIAVTRILGRHIKPWRKDEVRLLWIKAFHALRQAKRILNKLGVESLAAAAKMPNPPVLRNELYEYTALAEESISSAKELELSDAKFWTEK